MLFYLHQLMSLLLNTIESLPCVLVSLINYYYATSISNLKDINKLEK